MTAIDHPERRADDVTVHELAERLGRVESWMEDNTKLTEKTHEKTEEMYLVFDAARNGFLMLAAIANFLLRIGQAIVATVEFLGRIAKPVFWIAAVISAGVVYWHTGKFAMPEWWKWFAP